PAPEVVVADLSRHGKPKPTEASRRSLTLIEVVLAKKLCASATVMLSTSWMDLSRCRTARIFGWKRRPSQTSHVAYMSSKTYISIFCSTDPWHVSQRPPTV